MALELSSTDPSGGLGVFALLLGFAVILALVPLFVWFVRRQRELIPPLEETRTDQLFMKIAYTTERESELPRQGYLRSLTSDRATLVVADRGLRKGSQLHLDLGNLRAQDGVATAPIRGKVTQMKSLGGSPENILVNIQFIEHNLPMHEMRQQQTELPPA
ncbi:MAG TPA: hypothetical protein VE954_40790 [Oligoflexus sp.]|uniref:hypothetical protein n=1 Tax=Oligoflexus sp. TaxID=1971216 RepID=UPI002D6CD550|nr:hypothetical protein [Oligoflexus sp.]HYX39479.1 hypothetical protein [Oligoflexus sp.]